MLKTAKKNPDSEKSETSQGLPSEPAGIQKTPEKPLNSKDPSKSSSDSIRSQTKSPKESSEENELEDSPRLLSPQVLEDEFEEAAQKKPEVGKLEPLPENWMLRKSVPKSEEKSNSPGLRSLIQKMHGFQKFLVKIRGTSAASGKSWSFKTRFWIFYSEQLRLALRILHGALGKGVGLSLAQQSSDGLRFKASSPGG